ncbi:MAG: hypothetical protein IKX81_04200, partial [Firmicutes bacterium]|nr:hypothetical protein [Bacillota bacterium]
WETNSGFVIYVGDTPKSDYDEYVSRCIESGFDVKYSRSDDYYYGDNEDGFHLSVSYYGNNIMVIRADEPFDYDWDTEEEDVSDETETEEPASEPAEESGEVSPEFKATMDEYEAFFDDYIAFMEKYNSADDTSLMAEDYTSFIEKFTTIMNDMNSIDPSSLSQADYNYYQQVLMRVFTKLAVLGI